MSRSPPRPMTKVSAWGDPMDLSGEVQDELVGLLRIDLWHLSPGQVTHEISFHSASAAPKRPGCYRIT